MIRVLILVIPHSWWIDESNVHKTDPLSLQQHIAQQLETVTR